MTTYAVIFTEAGEPVRTWTGFATRKEARRAIADLESRLSGSSIPLEWDWVIAEIRRP
jgi:hypothetical protein